MDWSLHFQAAVSIFTLLLVLPLNCHTTVRTKDDGGGSSSSKIASWTGPPNDQRWEGFMCVEVRNRRSVIDSDESGLEHATRTSNHDIRFEKLDCELKSDTKELGIISIRRDELIANDTHPDQFHFNDETYQRKDFCIRSINGDRLELFVCREKLQKPLNISKSLESLETGTTVLNKCCKVGQKVLMNPDATSLKSKYSCVSGSNGSHLHWNPALFNKTAGDFSRHNHVDDSHINVSYQVGFPNCTNFMELNNRDDIWFKIMEDGSVNIGLKFWFKAVWLPIESDNGGFCVDDLAPDNHNLSDSQDINQTLTTFSPLDPTGHYHKDQVLLYCRIHRFNDYLFHRKLFGSLCLLASMIILVILVIYLSIWDTQNLAGWTQFNIFVAVFFVFGMEGSRTLIDSNGLLVEATDSCTIIAAIAQYFFFALNTTWSVMCFDLFWTFWKLEASVKGVKQHKKRLLGYLLFSWAVPLVIVCVGFAYSHLSATDAKTRMEGVYAFAHRRCSSPIRELGFQSQGIMFLLNLCFFGCTAFLIWKHRRGMNASRRNSRKERHTWTSVILFMKLIIVMGVASLSMPLDFFFGSEDPLSYYAVFLRGVHLIPVVAILFIFGVNEKNLRLMRQKYPKLGEVMELCHIKTRGFDTSPSKSEKNSTNLT